MAMPDEIFLKVTLCVAVGAILFSLALALEGVEQELSLGPASDEDLDGNDDPALDPGPEPSYSDSGNLSHPQLPPEPSPGYYKFLEQCAMKMSPDCSDEVFAALFQEETLTKPCCCRLVDMGRECHDGLVKILLTLPELKPNASRALLKSNQIWNACASDGTIAIAPTFAGAPTYL